MKKLIILIFAALFVFSACKKPPEAQSTAQSEIENSGESLHIELTNPNIGVDDGNELIENTISYRYYSDTRMSSICSQGDELFMVKSNYKDDDYE